MCSAPSASSSPSSSSSGSASPSSSTCARVEPRSAPSSSWRPTASPTWTTTSSRPRSSTARSAWASSCSPSIGITLPLYWLAEPGRQSGAVDTFEETFVARGEELYNVGANCAACHGPNGVGGVASFTVTADGQYVATVSWKSPALDTVLFRYTREEVKSILIYGRGFSPDAGLGRGRRWPADRPAARQHHRLPLQHPAARRGGREDARRADREGLRPRWRGALHHPRPGQPGRDAHLCLRRGGDLQPRPL